MAFLAFCDPRTRAQALAALAGSDDPWNAVVHDPETLERLLATVRDNGYASMNKDYSRTSYNGVASAIGVPVLIGGVAVGSLNLMYLRNSLDEADVVARFVAPLRAAAAEIADALSAMRGRQGSGGIP
jgi:IclR family mhp operon transcriptional activator